MESILGISERKSDEAPPVPEQPFWKAPLEFAVHALVGIFVFGTITIPALGAELVIGQLEVLHFNSMILLGLKAVAYALFLTDLLLFAIFLFRAAKRALRNL